jgi:hypothetical protein
MRCKDLRLRMPQVSAKDAGFAGALPVFERSDRVMTQQLNLPYFRQLKSHKSSAS